MVPKRELTFVLPYLGKLLFDLRASLRRTIERALPYCKLKIIFRSKCKLNTLFRFKDPLEKKIRSGIIYCYMCSNLRLLIMGKPSVGAAEHMGISNLTGKSLKNVKQSAISDHLLQCNCAINFDDFSILATDCNKFKLLLGESLLIKRDKSILNRTIKSFPLEMILSSCLKFHSNHLSDFVLIYNSNFILCTDRARICFKCHIEKERKCSFENGLMEKSESSTNLK